MLLFLQTTAFCDCFRVIEHQNIKAGYCLELTQTSGSKHYLYITWKGFLNRIFRACPNQLN